VANHKSAIKRVRQSEDRRVRNRAVKTRLKNVVKIARQTAAGGGAEPSEIFKEAQSAIDKAAKKGVIHKRTASRKIARLQKLFNAAS
jgi:small subunit ribosomal protein S20